MSPSTPPTRPAWENRWTTPTFEELLAVQKEQHQNLLTKLLESIEEFEGISSSIVWYGSAWKWTLEYAFDDDGADTNEPLAYFVPDPEAPILCIPLREEMIDQLPLKRLNRYIREGVRGAKCAVEIHWAKWTPTAMTEVEYLLDLIKRKHKMVTGKTSPKKSAG